MCDNVFNFIAMVEITDATHVIQLHKINIWQADPKNGAKFCW